MSKDLYDESVRKPLMERKDPTPDINDVMNLAYFWEMLFKDGDTMTSDDNSTSLEASSRREAVPLHEAIVTAMGNSVDAKPHSASLQEISALVLWMAKKCLFTDCWILRKRMNAKGGEKAPGASLTKTSGGNSESSKGSTESAQESGRQEAEQPQEIAEDADGKSRLHGIQESVASVFKAFRHSPSMVYEIGASGPTSSKEEPTNAELQAEKDDAEASKHYQVQMWVWIQYAEALFKSDNFHGVNVNDIAGAKELVHQTIRLDRLPRQNNLEGLRLLRSAWDEFDVSMQNAGRYKFWAKLLFRAQLVLQLGVIQCSVLQQDDGTFGIKRRLHGFVPGMEAWSPDEACGWLSRSLGLDGSSSAAALLEACPSFLESFGVVAGAMPSPDGESRRLGTDPMGTIDFSEATLTISHLIFIFAVMSSFVISLTAYMNPLSRWRHLRSGAIALESLIWQYRARIGTFAQSTSNPSAPEKGLCAELSRWRGEFLSSEEASSLQSSYPQATYRHGQYRGQPEGVKIQRGEHVDKLVALRNDHQSPVKPTVYITMRLTPMMMFYQARLPRYGRRSRFWTLMTLVFSAVCSALAYFKLNLVVAMLSGVTSGIVCWIEFEDLQRKIERYSNAIRSIKALKSWWDSLTPAERASTLNISRLILEGESIITSENQGWRSKAPKTAKPDDSSQEKDEVCPHCGRHGDDSKSKGNVAGADGGAGG